MTILFCEGFENYNKDTDLAGVWGPSGINVNYQQTGRDASGVAISLGISSSILLGIAATDPGWIGFGFKGVLSSAGLSKIVRFTEVGVGSAGHVSLSVNPTDHLVLERGSTTIATSARTLTPNQWVYIECRWLIDDAAGTFEVYVNGKKGGWIDFGPGDTRAAGGAVGTVTSISFPGWNAANGGPFFLDDMYILDENGTAPGNTRLGDSIVETLNPSGVGAEAQWTPSAGANQENVDEATPDDDTTFNSSINVDDDDRFAMDNLVNIPSTVFCVQVNGMFRLENSGARDVRLKVTDGVTEGQSVDKTPTFDPAYAYELEVFEDHPTDANPWSTAEVNAMEAGYRIQA